MILPKLILLAAVAVAAAKVPTPLRIPPAAEQYRARLTREAHARGGLTAPVSMFAAQLNQESQFNPNARSHVGATGLGQFMPSTAVWLTQVAPKDFPTANSLDADWSIRALVYYDYWLHARLPKFQEGEQRWAGSLASYNGGLGWTLRDQKLASACDSSLWFGCVENVVDGRNAANLRENRGYPQRIMHVLRPLYDKAGWR
ncbi:MAG TPA: transglycosylase SLT domain-containing protein [Terriglobales bacterium]|nr:transglycosylase SLT domain-containing protein [Terriglobales bacterium]